MNRATAARHDRESVLRLLTTQGPLSQLQLVRLTQLGRSTISTIIQEFKTLELIRESAFTHSGHSGHKEILVGLSPTSAWSVGLDFHVTGTKFCLVNGAGQIIAQQTFSPQRDIESFARELAPTLDDHISRLKLSDEKCAGVGVSVPGLVNPGNGTVYKPELNWDHLPLGDLLAKGLGRRVHVERDVSCGAYGERHAGRARTCENFLYILIHPRKGAAEEEARQSYSYGVAIVLNGQIHRGSNFAAGEMDDVLTLDPMKENVNLDSRNGIDEQQIDALLDSLGRTVASLTNLLDPERVVLCADRHLLTDHRIEKVDTACRKGIINIESRRFHLIDSSIGVDGLPYGAGILCLHRKFKERLHIL